MIKKRKNFSSNFPAELSDSNEQELAKDTCTDIKGFFEAKTGRDSSDENGKSLPENISNKQHSEDNSARSLPAPDEIPRLAGKDTTDGQKQIKETPPSQRGRQKFGSAVYIAVIVLCLVTGIAAPLLSAARRRTPEQSPFGDISESTQAPADTQEEASPSSVGAQEIYRLGEQSTVTVISEKNGERTYFSGFCIFDGFVATVSDAALGERVQVLCADGSSHPSSVRSCLPELGIALLQTDASLVPAPLGDCSSLATGDRIYTVSGAGDGIHGLSLISAKAALPIQTMSVTYSDGEQRRAGVLQIDSPCSGNISGSPVFNSEGKIVAMAASLKTSSGNDCLALPIDTSLPVFECMRDGVSPSLEIMAAVAYSPAHLGILGINTKKDGVSGVEIREFTSEQSDAAKFLRVGDLIYKVGNAEVADTQALSSEIECRAASDTVEVFVIRGSQNLSFNLKLY